MELRNSKRWIVANYCVLATFVICIALSQAPYRWTAKFGISKDDSENIAALIAAIPIFFSTRLFALAVEKYEPSTSLEAKRANEQIKLTANFANAAANTFAGAIAIGQLLKENGPNNGLIALGVFLAALIHSFGRGIVSNLKDETVK